MLGWRKILNDGKMLRGTDLSTAQCLGSSAPRWCDV
jgi:hypothetical protein